MAAYCSKAPRKSSSFLAKFEYTAPCENPASEMRRDQPFRVLLYRIARNRSVDHFRKTKRTDLGDPTETQVATIVNTTPEGARALQYRGLERLRNVMLRPD